MKNFLVCVTLSLCTCGPSNELDRSKISEWAQGSINSHELMSLLRESEAQIDFNDPDSALQEIKERVRRRVIENELERIAPSLGLNLTKTRLQVERSVAMDIFHDELASNSISDDDLRRQYEARQDDFKNPARRLTLHYFKRGSNRDTLKAAVKKFRGRLDSGETFQSLAYELSDSTSRHQKGQLGWIRESDVPSAIWSVISSLPMGELSQPIYSNEGVHLFLVKDHMAEFHINFEDARKRLIKELRFEQLRTSRNSRLSEMTIEHDFWCISADVLSQDTQLDRSHVIMRSNDYELTSADLNLLVSEATKYGWRNNFNDLVDFLKAREVIYFNFVDRLNEPAIKNLVRKGMTSWIHTNTRQRLLKKCVTDDMLLEYFRLNQDKYETELELKLDLLNFPCPLRIDPNYLMGHLEDAASHELSSDEFNALTQMLEIKPLDIGWNTVWQAGTHYPGPLAYITSLKPGWMTPPLFRNNRYIAVYASARKEPVLRSLEEVKSEVLIDFVNSNCDALIEDLENELINQSQMHTYDENIQSFISSLKTPLPQPNN